MASKGVLLLGGGLICATESLKPHLNKVTERLLLHLRFKELPLQVSVDSLSWKWLTPRPNWDAALFSIAKMLESGDDCNKHTQNTLR